MTLTNGKLVLASGWKTTNTAKGDNKLYSDAKGVVPSLDLRFAESKALNDYITGQNLITFSRASSGTYVDDNGVIQSATTNTPRFDHDPATGESLGLLIEEARTNDVYESENIANGSQWVVSNVSSTAGFNAPDGSTNAVRILENTANLAHFTFWNVSSALTTATVSAFVKPIGREYLGIRAYRAGNVWENIVFNVTGEGSVVNYQSGTSSSYSNVQGFIEKHADGWYRISITCTNTAGVNLPLVLSTHATATPTLNVTGEEAFLGDASKGFYAWGAQIENGSFPTSYIPNTTGSSSVTRAADVAEITGANFSSWYNQTEGTVFADWSQSDLDRVNIYGFSDGGTTGTLSVYNQPSSNVLVTYTSSVAGGFDQSVASVAVTSGKHAVGYISGDTQPAYGGSLSTAILETNLPTSNRLNLGKSETGQHLLNGHIKRLAYFPTRLPDATLQSITT